MHGEVQNVRKDNYVRENVSSHSEYDLGESL